MEIRKELLRTLWYEDGDGNIIPHDPEKCGSPAGAKYQISRFPTEVTTRHLRLPDAKKVAACRHPRKHIKPTYGWIDGVFGRECSLCGGTQLRHKWHFWPRKWDANSSKEVFSCTSHYSTAGERCIVAMVNSGDYTLSEAILAYTESCERCSNVLLNKYLKDVDGVDHGYEEYSEEWKKTNTACSFCRGNSALSPNPV